MILTVVGAVIFFKAARFLSKRISLLKRIYSLKRSCNAKITLHKSPFRPMWRATADPDMTIEILDTVYLVRIYSGGGSLHSVHFASEKFSCVYLRLRPSQRSPHGTGASSLAMSSGINLSAKVHVIDPLAVPTVEADGKRYVRVIIFNPAPGVLSYVTPEKTSIKIAFTGDDLWGVKVFTDFTFIRYAERMMREEERLKSEDPEKYEFFTGA